MKKRLLGLLFAAVALCASASEADLLEKYSAEMSWSGASLSGNTATWTEAWGGLAFNLENKDYSAYDYVVFEFAAPSQYKMKVEAYYGTDNTAGSSREVEAGATQIKLDLDKAQCADVAKIALISAKPVEMSIVRAVLTDEYKSNPVVFEGEAELVNMNTNFTVKADKFEGLAAGQKMTVYFTVGTNANYGTIQLCYGWTKMACDATRTNTKPDGNYEVSATETAVVITDAADVAGLKKSGLRIKGKNVTIRKIVLSDAGEEPEPPVVEPGPDEPENPADGYVWTGTVDTGNWANDVTVDAAAFAAAKAGDKLVVSLAVNAGSEYGNIELDDQQYVKLACDGSGDGLDSYGCIQPDVKSIVYTLTDNDAALLRANGLRVKGANITISGIALKSDGTGNEPVDGDVWTGSVDTGNWANDVTVEPAAFAKAKAGDIITVHLSVNAGAEYGSIEMDDQNYTKLAMDGNSTGLDSYGCVQPETTEVPYVITNSDITLLKSNGLRVKGANITITAVSLSTGEALDPDPEPTDVEVIWSGNVNCGQWKQSVSVDADKFAKAKAGDKLTVYLTRNAGKGTGTPEVSAGNGTVLGVNGKGTNLDGSGNLVKGATEVTYVLDEADLSLLRMHGLLIRGFAVTITKVSLQIMPSSGIGTIETDADDAPVEYYDLNGMRVGTPSAGGIYICRRGSKVSKVLVR